jgi:hypothetical protein
VRNEIARMVEDSNPSTSRSTPAMEVASRLAAGSLRISTATVSEPPAKEVASGGSFAADYAKVRGLKLVNGGGR